MKKGITSLVGVVCLAMFMFIGIDVQTGCACTDIDEIVENQVLKVTAEYKAEKNLYPSFEEVQKRMVVGAIQRYESTRPDTQGVFYSSNGDSYTLKRYEHVTFFGTETPLLWEVK